MEAGTAGDAGARAELAAAALAAARSGSATSAQLRDAAWRALPPSGSETATLVAAAETLIICDAYDEAERALGTGTDDALLSPLGHLQLRRGRLADARSLLSEAFERGRIDTPEGRGLLVATAARLIGCECALGDVTRAGAVLTALEPVVAVGDDAHRAVWLLGRAEVRALAGDSADALEDALTSGAGLLAAGRGNPAFRWWRSRAAELALGLGDRDRARHLAGVELVRAQAFGATVAIGRAQRVLGASGPVEFAATAVETLSGTGAELELARAQIEYGSALRRAGQRRDARDVIRLGLESAERLGAVPLATRAREEMASSGARPRRDAVSGVDALTPSERRVAELAAGGYTNRQIAQELFVTVRTVTTHLTHIFVKLGIEGRGDLAGILGEPDDDASAAEAVGAGAVNRPPSPPAPTLPALRAASATIDPAVSALLAQLPALMAELSPAARELAIALAVLQSTTDDLLTPTGDALLAAGLGPGEGAPLQAELLDSGLIGEGAGGRLGAEIAGAIYSALTPAQRAAGHRAAAHASLARPLGPGSPVRETAAEHASRTPPSGEAQFVELLRDAARDALAAGAPSRAITHLRRALIEPPHRELFDVVTTELADAESLARDPAADARFASLPPEADLEVGLRLAEVQYLGGRTTNALHSLAAAQRRFGDEVDPRLRARLEALRLIITFGSGRASAESRVGPGQLRMLAVAAGDVGGALDALDAFAEWATMRDVAGPLARLSRSIAAGRLLDGGYPEREAVAGLVLAQLIGADAQPGAERAIAALFASAASAGAVGGAVMALTWSAHLALRLGDVTGAVADAEAAAELADGRDLGGVTPLLAAFQAAAYVARGAVEQAATALERVSLSGLERSAVAGYVSLSRARVLTAQGRTPEAVTELERCRTLSAGTYLDDPGVLPARSALAVLVAADAPERAAQLVGEELTLARRRRLPRAIGVALLARARIDDSGAVGPAREAVTALAGSAARLEHAEALALLGERELVAGDVDAARAALTEALERALAAGAVALAEASAARLADCA